MSVETRKIYSQIISASLFLGLAIGFIGGHSIEDDRWFAILAVFLVASFLQGCWRVYRLLQDD